MIALSYIFYSINPYLGVFLFMGYILTMLDIWNIIGNKIHYHWNRFRQLNNLVSYKHKAYISIFIGSMQLVFKMLYLSFLNYMDSRSEKINKDITKINMTHNGKLISFYISNKINGPDDIILIINENNDDVTNDLISFFRLKKLLIELTPENLGFQSLEIHTSDKEFTFNKNEKIKL